MTTAPDKIVAAIQRGFGKRGLPNERADIVHRLLLADGPMTSAEIAERLGVPFHAIKGSVGALDLLLADGRAFSMHGHGPARMYYATEDDE